MKATIKQLDSLPTVRARKIRKAKDVGVKRSQPSKVPYKGRHVYTVEEIAQRDCPFPDESEWLAEWEKTHADKGK